MLRKQALNNKPEAWKRAFLRGWFRQGSSTRARFPPRGQRLRVGWMASLWASITPWKDRRRRQLRQRASGVRIYINIWRGFV